MSIMSGVFTALFIIALVFFVLVLLWLIVRVLGTVIQSFEKMQSQLKAVDAQQKQQG